MILELESTQASNPESFEGDALPVCLFENPYRLVSLWEMIIALASDLVALHPNLQEIYYGLEMGGEDVPSSKELASALVPLIALSKKMVWTDLEAQARRLLKRAQHTNAEIEKGTVGGVPVFLMPESTVSGLAALANDLKEAFQEKLSRVHIALIPEQDTVLLKDATADLCGGRLKGDLAISEEELNLAGRALAFGLSTATVAHAMRSVEASLHVIATVLGISFPGGIQIQDWAVLTEKIKSEIATVQAQGRSQQKADQLKTLSELILPADAFRLVWRNHVAHAREKYEEQEARIVLKEVGRFLKTLSDAI